MEIEVGEYCRFKNGNIAKIVNIDRFLYFDREVYKEDGMPIHCLIREKIYLDFIVKHSKNIIELIEVGDYVNGYLVLDKDLKNEMICLLMPLNEENQSKFNVVWNTKHFIKTILTKEQYEQNSYKL